MKNEIGIIIPCYNEGSTIESLLISIMNIAKISPANILVVDDGSTDNTATNAKKHSVNVVSHSTNSGKGTAIKTGIDFFKLKHHIKAVIIMDGDGQHCVEDISCFIAKYEANKDNLIIGSRAFAIKKMPFARILSNYITSGLISFAIKQKILDSQSGYRLLDTKAMDVFNPVNKGFQAESEMISQIAKSGLKIGFVKIKTIYFEQNASKINPVKDTCRFVKWYSKSFLLKK